MDLFPSKTGSAGSSSSMSVLTPAVVTTKGIVMGYFDGNTVTALWNYAQNFALNDNSYNSTFRTVHAGRGQPDLRPDERNHQATVEHSVEQRKSPTGRAVSR